MTESPASLEIRWTAPPHPACLSVDDLLKRCQMSQTRRGGPGGQHRNKTSTTIVLEHMPSGVFAEASERRSQADNRRVAIRRLRETLAVTLRTDPNGQVEHYAVAADDEVEPVDWLFMVNQVRRVHGGNLRLSENNTDRPAVLAVLLDDVLESQGALQRVAQHWRTSASQIVRFLKELPDAFQWVNRFRGSVNLGPLK